MRSAITSIWVFWPTREVCPIFGVGVKRDFFFANFTFSRCVLSFFDWLVCRAFVFIPFSIFRPTNDNLNIPDVANLDNIPSDPAQWVSTSPMFSDAPTGEIGSRDWMARR